VVDLFKIDGIIPGYYFQVVVGIYVVELTVLLTILSTSIERGVDDTTTHYRIGKNLFKGVTLYVIIALIGIIVFNLLANAVGSVG